MQEQQQKARDLYFNTNKTQIEIARETGVSDRTIRFWIKKNAWERLKNAAYAAPAIITDNICSQLVELQNKIAMRDEGKRYPTMQEAEITRKLITCIEKLKRYPSLGAQMQTMRSFTDHVTASGQEIPTQMEEHIQSFFNGPKLNQYAPYEMEYGIDPTAFPLTSENIEEEIIPEAENKDEEPIQKIENEPLITPPVEIQELPETETTGSEESYIEPDFLTDEEKQFRGKNAEYIVGGRTGKYLKYLDGRLRPIPPHDALNTAIRLCNENDKHIRQQQKENHYCHKTKFHKRRP